MSLVFGKKYDFRKAPLLAQNHFAAIQWGFLGSDLNRNKPMQFQYKKPRNSTKYIY